MKYSRALNSGAFFWIVLLLTGAVVLWASVFKLDKSVIVSGQVSPLGKPVPVQSRYEGKIKTIHVKVGDRISVGASLVDFDSEQELSDREEAHLDLIRLDIEQRRLAAQLRLAVDFPRQTNDDLRIWLDQKRVLVSEVSNLKQDLAVLAQEKQVKLGTLASFESKLVALGDALMLFKRKLQLTQALYDKGFTGDIALMEAKKAVSDIIRERADVQLSIDNLSNEVDLIEGKAQSRRLDFERQVSGALLEVRQAKELASFRFTAAAARLKSRSLSAPVAGMVSKVATNYVGEVTMAGDTLIEIIPEGQPLVFYVQIEVADIDDVAAGQEASVTLANMNSRVDSDLKGSLVSVDPDATTDKDSGRSFYGAVIALPENDRVLPGMTGTASLKLGERTVIEYFIEPLLYGLRGALSETY